MAWRVVLLAVLLFGGAGCAVHGDRLNEIQAAYMLGGAAMAEAKIEEFARKNPAEADVLKLDRACILLSEGRTREAEQLLREVRDQLDHLEQADLAEGVLSLFTDDRRLAYAGEDYEKVLVRAYLALASLLGDGEDATAYALQVDAKQREIIEAGADADGNNPKQAYKRAAVGAYLHALLREQTHLHYDDAARSMQQVCAWEPDFRAGPQDLERLCKGRHSAPGNGVVYVFTLVGRGPYKEERWEVPTTAALLVADRILTYTTKHSLPPTIAPIKVPRVVTPVNEVQGVNVAVDDQLRGQTETLTDVGRLAVQQADAVFDQVLGRAIARRVTKKAVVFGVKQILGAEQNALVNLAFDAAGVVWEAAECADTRCWGLLPEKIQVLRLELPAGRHQLALQPVGAQGVSRGTAESVVVKIDDGRDTFVLANFPTERLAGRIVTNQQPH